MKIGYDTIPETALTWHTAGRGAVLATVMQTWGSALCQSGSQLVVSGDGEFQGSVSGGCVEGAVITQAQEALVDGQIRLLEYGVSDEMAFAAGLACGGTIRVLVEPVGAGLPEAMLAELVCARAARCAVAYVVNPQTGVRKLADATAYPDQFRMDKSCFVGDEFVHIHNPPLKLVIVGAVHIAQPLLSMAKLVGYDVTLVDPRSAFASKRRFPDAKIVEDWPDEALQDIGLDVRTAVVTLTHDPKLDDPAIQTALTSDVFYLGCLGSKRTHAKRVERLSAAGFGADVVAKIQAPVGLDIGSKSPTEIAISIMAQITQHLRQRP